MNTRTWNVVAIFDDNAGCHMYMLVMYLAEQYANGRGGGGGSLLTSTEYLYSSILLKCRASPVKEHEHFKAMANKL